MNYSFCSNQVRSEVKWGDFALSRKLPPALHKMFRQRLLSLATWKPTHTRSHFPFDFSAHPEDLRHIRKHLRKHAVLRANPFLSTLR